jgi:hypothetical protein
VLFHARKEETASPSFSLYQAINNLYNKRGHLREVAEG